MDIFETVNGLASALLAMLLAWMVLTPQVRDGIVIKLGLISMALGFAATAWALLDGIDCSDANVMARAQGLINAGLVVVVLGAAWRLRAGWHALTHWADWDLAQDSEPNQRRGKT